MTFPAANPIPGHQGAPASATPVGDYLAQPRPGVTPRQDNIVLPRAVLERLPLPLQQRLIAAIAEVHQVAAGAPWAEIYRVTTAQWMPIAEMDEQQLAEVGIYTVLTDDGDVEHRYSSSGKAVENLKERMPVVCDDPSNPPSGCGGFSLRTAHSVRGSM